MEHANLRRSGSKLYRLCRPWRDIDVSSDVKAVLVLLYSKFTPSRIIFFLSVALTSGAMLIERNEGILERCLVYGVTGVEILFSHVISQLLVMFIQTAMVIVFSFYVFDITLRGELASVVLMTVLTGLCGMSFGKRL